MPVICDLFYINIDKNKNRKNYQNTIIWKSIKQLSMPNWNTRLKGKTFLWHKPVFEIL